jgi:hypothetical protein
LPNHRFVAWLFQCTSARDQKNDDLFVSAETADSANGRTPAHPQLRDVGGHAGDASPGRRVRVFCAASSLFVFESFLPAHLRDIATAPDLEHAGELEDRRIILSDLPEGVAREEIVAVASQFGAIAEATLSSAGIASVRFFDLRHARALRAGRARAVRAPRAGGKQP